MTKAPKQTETTKPQEAPETAKQPRKNRNLLILGFLSIGIAFITTFVSLVVYHKSGDIYLDRSRPGFLPDEQELQRDDRESQEYKMTDNGDLDKGKIDEYLEHYMDELNKLDELSDPFSATPLSDESLGIPKE